MSERAFEHYGISAPLVEPQPWKFDGDLKRKAPVVDPNDNRVIRHVGYRRCLTCAKHFWSEDVVRLWCPPGMPGSALAQRPSAPSAFPASLAALS